MIMLIGSSVMIYTRYQKNKLHLIIFTFIVYDLNMEPCSVISLGCGGIGRRARLFPGCLLDIGGSNPSAPAITNRRIHWK